MYFFTLRREPRWFLDYVPDIFNTHIDQVKITSFHKFKIYFINFVMLLDFISDGLLLINIIEVKIPLGFKILFSIFWCIIFGNSYINYLCIYELYFEIQRYDYLDAVIHPKRLFNYYFRRLFTKCCWFCYLCNIKHIFKSPLFLLRKPLTNKELQFMRLYSKYITFVNFVFEDGWSLAFNIFIILLSNTVTIYNIFSLSISIILLIKVNYDILPACKRFHKPIEKIPQSQMYNLQTQINNLQILINISGNA